MEVNECSLDILHETRCFLFATFRVFFCFFKLQSYKERVRQELQRNLQAELEKRTSQQHTPESSPSAQVSLELTKAVPPTETLNSDAAKSRAELARQGSLRERSAPAAALAAQAAAAAAVASSRRSGTSSVNSSFEVVESVAPAVAVGATPASTASSVAAGQAAVARRKRVTVAGDEGSGSSDEVTLFPSSQCPCMHCSYLHLCLLALSSFVIMHLAT